MTGVKSAPIDMRGRKREEGGDEEGLTAKRQRSEITVAGQAEGLAALGGPAIRSAAIGGSAAGVEGLDVRALHAGAKTTTWEDDDASPTARALETSPSPTSTCDVPVHSPAVCAKGCAKLKEMLLRNQRATGLPVESPSANPSLLSMPAAEGQRLKTVSDWEIEMMGDAAATTAGSSPSPVLSMGGRHRKLERASGKGGSGGRRAEGAGAAGAAARQDKAPEPRRSGGAPRSFPGCPFFGISLEQGQRSNMEDAVGVVGGVGRLAKSPPAGGGAAVPSDIHFFGVFDGHGGSGVSKHCSSKMPAFVAAELAAPTGRPIAAGTPGRDAGLVDVLVNAYRRTDASVDPEARLQGSTAITAIVTSTSIVVGNAGDSRAVLARAGDAVAVSMDHKPDRPDELARIEGAGGHVLNWNGWRLMGVLAMSRAIGDHYLRPYIIPDPEVSTTPRGPNDEFMILASDGLWDVIGSKAACQLVRKTMERAAEKGVARSKAIKMAAAVLSRAAIQHGTRDNVSVVVVDLRENYPTEASVGAATPGNSSAATSGGTGGTGTVSSGSEEEVEAVARPPGEAGLRGQGAAGVGRVEEEEEAPGTPRADGR